MDEWIELNRVNWDERAEPHARSAGYAVEQFVTDADYLSDVVRFDLPASGTSRVCAASTCNATSGRTPFRCTGSVRG